MRISDSEAMTRTGAVVLRRRDAVLCRPIAGRMEGGTNVAEVVVVSSSRERRRLEPALLGATLGAFVAGGVAWLLGHVAVADLCWSVGTAVAVVPSLVWVVAALRRGRAGVDLLATISLVGTLAVNEYVAGSLIAVMVATGRALELLPSGERRGTCGPCLNMRHARRAAASAMLSWPCPSPMS